MKRSKFLLTMLMAALFVGFTSCSDDDETDLRIEKSVVDLEVGEKVVVKITEGNGDYTVVSSDKEVADATVKDSEILISGLKLGSTTITVTDKEAKTATITVNVVNILGVWGINEEKVSVEVKANEDVAEEIKTKLATVDFELISLKEDGTCSLNGEKDGESYSIEGTYVYVDKILTLALGEEGNIETRTFTVTEITKDSTLKLKEDKTEFYQAEYPEGEVTEAVVFLELETVIID